MTTEEPVLLGAAMLGAVAGSAFADLAAAMSTMSKAKDRYPPTTDADLMALHNTRFATFEKLQDVCRGLTAARPRL